MTTLCKFLFTLLLTASFAMLLLPYCWVGLLLARGVMVELSTLFAHFGSTAPGWLEIAVALPVVTCWVATPTVALVFAFIRIWDRPKRSCLTGGKG